MPFRCSETKFYAELDLLSQFTLRKHTFCFDFSLLIIQVVVMAFIDKNT